jgi:4-methylaminobutanoate oxidase (formaldehyde-forming)
VQGGVALFDQSSFAKFLVEGADALAVLNRVAVAEMDVPAGRVVYTQWCNEAGGIEADLTVTRLGEASFLVVTGAAVQTRDLAWLRRHVPEDARCQVVDVTSGLATLALTGPSSRALLEALTGEDSSNAAFPFATSREVELGYARARASRITYVGELGYELYVPTEFAAHVLERVLAEGAAFGLRPAGYHAMNACRTEKGYRHWGHDIGPEDDPLAAGLGFCVAWGKAGGFVGRDALLRRREAGPPRRRLVQLRLLDDAKLLHHEEPVWAEGRIVGAVTSGMYGHRVGAPLGMGYAEHEGGVTQAWLEGLAVEVEVAWERVPARAQLKAWYDPKNERVRA